MEYYVKIGIKFNDLDYHNVFFPFMKILMDLVEWHEKKPTKQQIIDFFEEVKYGIFLSFQKEFSEIRDKERIKEYLTITEKNIYLDDEVNKYLENLDNQYDHNFYYFIYNKNLRKQVLIF